MTDDKVIHIHADRKPPRPSAQPYFAFQSVIVYRDDAVVLVRHNVWMLGQEKFEYQLLPVNEPPPATP